MAYIGSPPASRVLSSADIAQGSVTLDDINFTDQPTNMDISGTIDKHTMRLADGVTVVGDVTLSDNLILSKISDDGNAITLTNDSSTRTITGTGSLEASTLTQTPNASLTGMTGDLGSAVTGSVAGVTSFPAGHVLNTNSSARTGGFSTTNTSDIDIPDLNVSITPKSVSSKILVMASLGYLESTGTAAGDALSISLWRDATLIAKVINLGYDTASLETFGSSINFLDDPNTINLLNYKVTILSRTGSTVRVDYHAASSTVSSSIIVMEIAQ